MDLNEDNFLLLTSIFNDNEEYINNLLNKNVITEIYFNENENFVNNSTFENSSNDTPKINISNEKAESYENNEFTKIILNENENNKEEIKKFISQLNSIIIQKKSFNLIEKILYHESFQNILTEFKNSNILIEACKKENEEALNWLFTMNINYSVQDEKGMTALMYASKNPNLIFVVQHIVENSKECLNITDRNDENALFYAIHNIEAFKLLLDTDIDINHRNKDKNTVLLYCSKNKIVEPIKFLSYKPTLNANIVDKEGNPASFYLIRNGLYHEFQFLAGSNMDIDFKNEKNETLLSTFINYLYIQKNKFDEDFIVSRIKILMTLVQIDCNFNIVIDEYGNTPLMFFIMIEDLCTAFYILLFCKNLNVSMKNKKGESAFSQSVKLHNKVLIEMLLNHKSFDYDYLDNNNNNLLMLFSYDSNSIIFKKIISRNIKLLNQVNNKDENALIIATKACNKEAVNIFLDFNANIDQQDYLGNTALHYAVELNDFDIINKLINFKANINIKNKEGKSPLDLANEQNNEMIIDILNNRLPLKKPSKVEKRSNSLFSLRTIKKMGSKRSKSENSKFDKVNNIDSYKSKNIDNQSIRRLYKNQKIIELSISIDKNPYEPFKIDDKINTIEMETYYGNNEIFKSKNGISKSNLYHTYILKSVNFALKFGDFFF